MTLVRMHCQVHKNLSQNCGSDGHYEVEILMGSKVMTEMKKRKQN